MRRELRLVVAVVAVVTLAATAALLGGRSGGGQPQTFATGAAPGTPLPARCLPLPGKIEMPAWFPDELPLPAGTHAIEEFPGKGVKRLALTVPTTLDDFVRFALDRWPGSGWELPPGSGEREPGEAEGIIVATKGDRYGQFIAREVFCSKDHIQLLIVIAPREAQPRRSPSPSPAAS